MGNAERKSGRRPVRPTIKCLLLLPIDSFPIKAHASQIAARNWAQVNISTIAHPLLRDAQKEFSNGLPTTHREATRTAKRPVYEVRSRTGAGWRGAVVLDEEGDPWLIWAAKHDEFHSRVANVLKGGALNHWLPITAEFKLRARDEAEAAHEAWRLSSTTQLLQGLATALDSEEQRSSLAFPAHPSRKAYPPELAEMSLWHDQPTSSPADDSSMLTLIIRASGASPTVDLIIQSVLPAIQSDLQAYDAHFTPDGHLEIWISLTQAQLTQILAGSEIPAATHGTAPTCEATGHLHYVDHTTLADFMITGSPARGICGQWFVPTRDESSGLPVCPACDDQLPVARKVREIIEQTLRRQP